MRLSQPASGLADADGVCVLTLTPRGAVRWVITTTSVRSTSTLPARVDLYDGDPGNPADPSESPTWIEGTLEGNLDTTDTVIELAPTQALTIVWTGCTPGAACSVRVIGTQEALGNAIR